MTPAATTVRIDRRIELVSIVSRLAGHREYNLAPATPYVKAADAAFQPFASHPAVEATRLLRAKHGIGYDAPIHLAVHLDAKLEPFGLDEIVALDKRWAGLDVATYAALLRDFAKESKLDEFLAGQREYITAVERVMREIVEREQAAAWFDGLFGARDQASFTVIPGPLNGSRNFGTRAGHEMIQVLGIEAPDGMPRADEQTTSLLVHEMAHSYINPVFEQHHATLRAAGEHVFALVRQQMEAQAYGDWRIMLNEAGVRAVTTLYMREKHGAAAGARAARSEQRLGFVWTNELAEVFRRLRGAKQPLAQYMPRVIEFFDGLAVQYRDGLPKMPFQGPINAALQDPVFVAPAGELATYATGIRDKLFARSPLVAPSESTFTDQPARNLVAYGSPASNYVVSIAAQQARIRITDGAIELGTKRFEGAGLVLIFTRFRADDPTRGIVAYTAARDADLVGINHGLKHGDRDWLVARKTAKGYEVLETGDFPRAADGAWTLP